MFLYFIIYGNIMIYKLKLLFLLQSNGMNKKPYQQQTVQIKQQLNKFINLLQNDFTQNYTDRRSQQEYAFSKKLSIILSASQPQSSSLQKEQSNPSANRSFETSSKSTDHSSQWMFQSLLNSTLPIQYLQLIQKLKRKYEDLKSHHDHYQLRCKQLQLELNVQKKANDEIIALLMKLDNQEKQLWSNYNLISTKYAEVVQKNRQFQEEFTGMKQSLIALQNDNDFMKKLIFHANQNYEALQKKCQELQVLRERNQWNTDRKNIKKSSTDNLLKSAKTRKNGQSPVHSQVQNSPSYDDFQQIYRKMILRTLKFKGKPNQIR